MCAGFCWNFWKNVLKKANSMALRKCPVESCDYHSAKGFYLIPEHPVRRQSWIDACKLPANFNKKICFQHFKVSDFINEITEEDIAQARFGKLKKMWSPQCICLAATSCHWGFQLKSSTDQSALWFFRNLSKNKKNSWCKQYKIRVSKTGVLIY